MLGAIIFRHSDLRKKEAIIFLHAWQKHLQEWSLTILEVLSSQIFISLLWKVLVLLPS